MVTLAAAYAFGLVKNQGLVDGNKRVAFVSPVSVLGLNGYDLDATEPAVVTTMEGVAASRVSEGALATWFRARLYRLWK
jgi:death-on-curing protein